MSANKENYILFYDGDCGLCNRSIQFILKNEKSNNISFCKLQSNYTEHFFSKHNETLPDLTTFYFFDHKKIYKKSEAFFKVIPHLKWYYRPLLLCSILPKKVTDFIYDWISKRRKTISKEYCFIPTKETKERFIN